MTASLQELLHSVGLTRMSNEIEQKALVSFRLRASSIRETTFKLGITRFGGEPDVPKDWVWPEWNGCPLPFIAQINLFEIASHRKGDLLPDSGMLSFFFDVDAFFETSPRDQRTWSVLYVAHTLSPFQRSPMPKMVPTAKRYQPGSVTVATEITLPDYSQYDLTSLQRLGLLQPLTHEEEHAYHRLQALLAQTSASQQHLPIHRFLGHADPVQWDMQSELPGEQTDWQLLFQMDSDEMLETDWGDTGRIYFWIRTQDLQQRNFHRVQLILQSN